MNIINRRHAGPLHCLSDRLGPALGEVGCERFTRVELCHLFTTRSPSGGLCHAMAPSSTLGLNRSNSVTVKECSRVWLSAGGNQTGSSPPPVPPGSGCAHSQHIWRFRGLHWAPELLPCDFSGPGMVLIANAERVGPAKHSPTHAPAIALGEHARVTRCKPREWHQRQERPALVAPHSSNACAHNLRRGLRLRHCSRAARRRRKISVHQQGSSNVRAHIVRSRGRWQCTATYRLWRLVCPRQ